MQQRLARYTSQKWSCEFLDALADVKSRQEAQRARLLGPSTAQRLLDAFAAARRRAILLDYDGTLMPFCDDPAQVRPDRALLDLLCRLGSCEDNAVVVVSGRDKDTLEKWLGDVPVGLVAEHGAWPVSYTHLDVYKRQERLGPSTNVAVPSRFCLFLGHTDYVPRSISLGLCRTLGRETPKADSQALLGSHGERRSALSVLFAN